MKPTKAAFGKILPNPKLKLLDQVREVCRLKHYSLRTEQSYVGWARRYLLFLKQKDGLWRHPREAGGTEVKNFLTQIYTHVVLKPGLGESVGWVTTKNKTGVTSRSRLFQVSSLSRS